MTSKQTPDQIYESPDLVQTASGWKYFCQSPAQAQVLNKLLSYPYPKDVDFVKEGSEAIFRFDGSKLKTVLAVIKNVP